MKDDFVMVPREIKRAFIDGRISLNEFILLIWIFLNTNPFDGRFEASYKELAEVFTGKIKEENIRKIISLLRCHNWIWFKDHRGRGGKFTIHPLNYSLTNRHIQTLKDFLITTIDEPTMLTNDFPIAEPDNNPIVQNHNLNERIDQLVKRFSLPTESKEITTSYNENEKENKNENKYSDKIENSIYEEKDGETNVVGRTMLKKMVEESGLLKK